MNRAVKALLVIALSGMCLKETALGQDRAKQAEATKKRVPVILAPVREMVFENRIEVSGTVEAKNTALVSARIEGTLDAVFVDEGYVVRKDQTKLFQMDRLNLTQSVDMAEQAVSVAKATVRARQATVARIKADLNKAQIDFDRYERLFKRDQAITKNAFEVQASRLAQVTALLAEAVAGVELAKATKLQGVSALAIARKNLSDSLVKAPINGVVSARILEPGEMAKKGAPVLRIEDLSVLEVSAFLPGKYYDRVIPGKTPARLRLGETDLGEVAISFKSPVVDRRLRTFEIKTVITPAPKAVAPGRLVQVGVILERRRGLGVPTAAVVTRRGRQAVFVAEGGRAKLVAVKIGLSTDDRTQIIAKDIRPGARVVAKGQRFCANGVLLKIVREGE